MILFLNTCNMMIYILNKFSLLRIYGSNYHISKNYKSLDLCMCPDLLPIVSIPIVHFPSPTRRGSEPSSKSFTPSHQIRPGYGRNLAEVPSDEKI